MSNSSKDNSIHPSTLLIPSPAPVAYRSSRPALLLALTSLRSLRRARLPHRALGSLHPVRHRARPQYDVHPGLRDVARRLARLRRELPRVWPAGVRGEERGLGGRGAVEGGGAA